VKRHRSPLHEVLGAYDLDPSEIETIEAVRRPPSWRPTFKVAIARSKEEAEDEETAWARRPGLRVYSDGSDIDGGVGAAAVLVAPGGTPKVLRYHLGPSTKHTVYEGEIIGLTLGVTLLRREISCAKASTAADNLACLHASTNRKPHPAHYLIDKLLRAIESLERRHPNIDFTLRWVPGHKGIEGNELADVEAKKAARGDSSSVEDLPSWLRETELPASLSRVRQTRNEEITRLAKAEWKGSPRAERMNRIDPEMPSKKYLKLAEKLPRKQASILIQLRTEHAPLQRYLFRIQKADTPVCPSCGRTRETVYHFLMECPAHNEHRDRLARDAGPAARSIKDLLNSPNTLKPLFRYIHDSGRFAAAYGDLELKDSGTAAKPAGTRTR